MSAEYSGCRSLASAVSREMRELEHNHSISTAAERTQHEGSDDMADLLTISRVQFSAAG